LAFLLESSKVPYSPTERRMFAVLPKRGKITSTDLFAKYWAGRKAPFHARGAAMYCLRSLKDKVTANKETFTIKTSERAGPRPVEVWIEVKR
jgi:hypothetical protein